MAQTGGVPAEKHRVIGGIVTVQLLGAVQTRSAYGGDDTRALALQRNLIPVVPPNPQRKQPWPPVKPRYRQRNEVERLFRRTKAYRRVFTRYYKLDLMFASFVSFALICEQLRYVNTP